MEKEKPQYGTPSEQVGALRESFDALKSRLEKLKEVRGEVGCDAHGAPVELRATEAESIVITFSKKDHQESYEGRFTPDFVRARPVYDFLTDSLGIKLELGEQSPERVHVGDYVRLPMDNMPEGTCYSGPHQRGILYAQPLELEGRVLGHISFRSKEAGQNPQRGE